VNRVIVSSASVLVVVVAVNRVPAPVVNVVDVIAVWDVLVAAPFAVNMVVTLMHRMLAGRLAFVVVVVVRSMKMPVMHVVDVITVRNRDMPAPVAMDMIMADVFVVCSGHFSSRPLRPVTDLILAPAHAFSEISAVHDYPGRLWPGNMPDRTVAGWVCGPHRGFF
jgi:hypothetical protein